MCNQSNEKVSQRAQIQSQHSADIFKLLNFVPVVL